jgi:hypothetical protein
MTSRAPVVRLSRSDGKTALRTPIVVEVAEPDDNVEPPTRSFVEVEKPLCWSFVEVEKSMSLPARRQKPRRRVGCRFRRRDELAFPMRVEHELSCPT